MLFGCGGVPANSCQRVPVSGRDDVSALEYDAESDSIYGVYDSSDKLVSITTDGVFVAEQTIPQADQEGLTRNGACEIFIAQDTNEMLWRY